jgi:hypothetical protein
MVIIIIPTHFHPPSVAAPLIIDIGPHAWIIVLLIFPPDMPNAQALSAIGPADIDLPPILTVISTTVMDFRHVSDKVVFQEQKNTNHELVTVSLRKEITFMGRFMIVIIIMNFLSPWNRLSSI